MANLIIKPTSGGSLVLQDEGGDAALTVGTTGDVSLAGTVTAGAMGSNVTGLGVQCAQMFFLTSNKANVTSASDITANISEASGNNTASHGSLVSQSSGIFSFSKTGIYWILFQGNTSYDNDAEYNIQMIKTTVDNGTYVVAQKSVASRPLETGSEGYANILTQCFFDVTNTTNCKVKFTVQATVNSNWAGNSDLTAQVTTFQFIRLSDT